jgi:cell division protein FtsZ
MEDMDLIQFNMPTEETSYIKVIGVGGGGSNAVNHMFKEGIKDVSFIVCNTDDQALKKSPVPKKIQLGPLVAKGLGAGNDPEKARLAAEESVEEIKSVLSNNTQMVFITAGMGGGTGTGAAPVIARVAKEMGILTVGIVTIPFMFEGPKKINQAIAGIKLMGENVDALLVINNELLCDIYGELDVITGFSKADDVLKDAAKGIAETITVHGRINLDFADVEKVMKDSGVAIMNTGYASGENRLTKAIDNALHSPLLKHRDVRGAKRILLNFYCREDETAIKMSEIQEITRFMETVGRQREVIWGLCIDNDLKEEVKITLIATGFTVEDIRSEDTEEQPVIQENMQQTIFSVPAPSQPVQQSEKKEEVLDEDFFEEHYGNTNVAKQQKSEMIYRIDDEKVIDELENKPAYTRRVDSAPQPYRPKDLSK